MIQRVIKFARSLSSSCCLLKKRKDSFIQSFPQPSCYATLGDRPIVSTMNWEIIEGFHTNFNAAMLVFQNKETVAMLGSQTNPVRVEDFSYANAFFCSKKSA